MRITRPEIDLLFTHIRKSVKTRRPEDLTLIYDPDSVGKARMSKARRQEVAFLPYEAIAQELAEEMDKHMSTRLVIEAIHSTTLIDSNTFQPYEGYVIRYQTDNPEFLASVNS